MKNKKTLDFQKIYKWFKDGEKPKNQWKIGTEHEKFLFKKNNFKDLVMKMKMVLNLFWKKFQKKMTGIKFVKIKISLDLNIFLDLQFH